MSKSKYIIGAAGGGSSTPRQAVEADDTLRSKAYANIIDAVSEGEIGGLANGLKSVYLDNTPLQNADGTYNFKDVVINARSGTIGQSYLDMGMGAENTSNIGVTLKFNEPAVRTITSNEVDICRVTLAVGQLAETNAKTGDVNGASVLHFIEYRSNGGAWNAVKTDRISGKTTSGYQREISFRLNGVAPWDVRVTRMTPDSTTQTLQNASSWANLTAVIEEKLRYPSTALFGVQFDAEQFSSIPVRSYDLKGLIISVPSNYDPITRAYTGSWNGTFKKAWSSNPAWCFFDLLTNELYGLGSRIDVSMIDKWQLYQIGKYCDALVPDGHGGTEPRFTCNLYLQTREEAYKVIQDMATIFRGITYWATGSIAVAQDSPQAIRYQFNNTNVEGGMFDRAGSSIKTRHNVALITWNDPTDRYTQKIEYVEDAEAIKKMGYVSQTEAIAFGCTSQGQARRYGEWLLFTEQYESEVITFTTGMEGAIPLPNDLIKVSDILKSVKRMGGRVASTSTIAAITLDKEVILESGKTYTLSIVGADGSYQEKPVTSTAGTKSILTVASPYSGIAENSTWILTRSGLEAETFRVIGIEEVESGKYKVSCLSHIASKFDHIERDKPLKLPQTTDLSSTKPDVKDVVINQETYSGSDEIPMTRISVSYQPANPLSTRFFVEYKIDDGMWQRTQVTSQHHAEIPMVSDNVTYTIRVVAGNQMLGVWNNAPTEYTYTPIAYVVPDISGLKTLTAWTTGKDVVFAWDSIAKIAAYDVQIEAAGSVVRSLTVKNTKFTYTAQDMKSDGGYWRTITFKVRARSKLGDVGTWSQINAANAQIGALQGLLVTSAINQAFFEFAQPTESDFAGVILWVGTAANFTVSDTNKVFTGNSPVITLTKLTDGTPLAAGTTYYLRAAGYDTFGQDGLTVSSSVAFTVLGLELEDGSVTTTKIADDAITTPKLLAGAITADKLAANSVIAQKIAANAISANHLSAGSVTADKMFVANLSAVSANLGNVNITKGQDSDPYGWIRTNGKWWADSVNGTIIARNNSSGDTFFDSKAGNNRIWMSSWNDCGIEFPGIRMTNGGLTINQLNVIDTANLADNSVTKSSTYRSDANVTVDGWATLASVSISCNASATLNIFSAFDCVAAIQNGSANPISMTTRLIVDGNVILESLCRTTSCAILDAISVGAGVHTIELKAYSTPVFNAYKAFTKKIRLFCISTFK